MRVLVTGADGFVGRHLVRELASAGHEPISAVRPGGRAPETGRTVALELESGASVADAVATWPDAIVHLAAVASGREARRDPVAAWAVNATGTARLIEASMRLRDSRNADPLVLIVSTGEVYGEGPGVPRVETDGLRPQSPYAASKVAAEFAALEAWWRTGLRVIVARPFPHTGRGQSPVYALPAFVARLREARATGKTEVDTGNLAPVRDLLDVRDVVRGYLALLD
ncbi:MAG: NAD-dependent epimerase/dehydratase family protein, partial [Gemmatimonadales bacterium]|nr:NAD-dependent epimerase/dehydratase family protein [Gemmatimonadales bacterium]